MLKQNNDRGYSELRIQDIYDEYIRQFVNLALSRFVWKGMPKEIDRRFMEATLLSKGSVAFYKTDGGLYMATDYINKGSHFTPYGLPTKIEGKTGTGIMSVFGSTMGTGTFHPTDDKFVLGFDNMVRRPLYDTLDIHARQLAMITITIMNNLKHQWRPYVLVANGNPQVRGTLNALMDVMSHQEESLVLDMDPDEIKTIDTHVEYMVNDLLDSFATIYQKALSELGITSQIIKPERMIAQEVTLSRMEDDVKLESSLMARRQFAEEINEMFGLNVEVNPVMFGHTLEGERNGEVLTKSEGNPEDPEQY